MTPHAESSLLHFTSKISQLASHKGLWSEKPVPAPREFRQQPRVTQVRAVHAAHLGDLHQSWWESYPLLQWERVQAYSKWKWESSICEWSFSELSGWQVGLLPCSFLCLRENTTEKLLWASESIGGTTNDMVCKDWTIKKATFSVFPLFIWVYKCGYKKSKAQAGMLCNVLLRCLLAPHQAVRHKKARKVSQCFLSVCFHFSSTPIPAELRVTCIGPNVRKKYHIVKPTAVPWSVYFTMQITPVAISP